MYSNSFPDELLDKIFFFTIDYHNCSDTFKFIKILNKVCKKLQKFQNKTILKMLDTEYGWNKFVNNWNKQNLIVSYEQLFENYNFLKNIRNKLLSNKNKLLSINMRNLMFEINPDLGNCGKFLQNMTSGYIKNMNKWKAANTYAKDRGWEFQIWTEKTLQEMKLLTKPVPGKLKKIRPYKPFRKKRKKKL